MLAVMRLAHRISKRLGLIGWIIIHNPKSGFLIV